MATVTMRANLNAQNFPFATELWGRSVVVSQYDQNYDKAALNIGNTNVVEKGIPQAFYMQNVLPTSQGYQAIGYSKVIEKIPGENRFDQIFNLTDPEGNRFLFSPSSGVNYVFDATVGTWASVSPFGSGILSATKQVSMAFVQGQTYLWFPGIGCKVYNKDTKTLDTVVLTSLSIPDILGITEASGYMIAYTVNTLLWSSLIDPTDFTPDITTGASNIQVSDAKGDIITVQGLSGGLVIYCDENAVGGRYSGNVNFPFILKEIPKTSGVRDSTQIAWSNNLDYHYAWMKNGLNKIELAQATQIYPEVSDFIAGQIFEDFDVATLTFSQEYLDTQLFLQLTVVSSRFLIISYGREYGNFTHALVYDFVLTRWGKLKINHRSAFDFNYPNLYGPITYGMLYQTPYAALIFTTYGDLLSQVNSVFPYKATMGFLQEDGTVYVADFQFAEGNENIQGVLLLGKYQLVRARRITHQDASVETIGANNNFNYYVIPTWDGKTLRTPELAFLFENSPQQRTYKKAVTGYNVSGLFVGQFNLVSAVFTFAPAGDDI